ncbi:MAG: TatD family hydrolase [Deltaproteobacteria bacterium]|nr:TatD family hydrolase [Candidatus Anaeroferrophillacea bacterium]
MPALFDTHCHLTDEPLAGRLEDVLTTARKHGVHRIMVPGYDPESSRRALALAARHEGICAAVGLHPGRLEPGAAFPASGLRTLLAAGSARAVGEIGLDYAGPDHDQRHQREVLEHQLDFAREFDLPVILHCRKAFQPLLDILRQHPGIRFVLHAFGGGPEMAAAFLDLGGYIAFGGGVTRPNARRVRRTAPMVPADRMVLETDAPYIGSHTVPKPLLEPRHLPDIAAALAALRGMEPEEIAAVTTTNANRLFRIAANS